MELHVYKNNDELSAEVAVWITDYIVATLKTRQVHACVIWWRHPAKAEYITGSSAV